MKIKNKTSGWKTVGTPKSCANNRIQAKVIFHNNIDWQWPQCNVKKRKHNLKQPVCARNSCPNKTYWFAFQSVIEVAYRSGYVSWQTVSHVQNHSHPYKAILHLKLHKEPKAVVSMTWTLETIYNSNVNCCILSVQTLHFDEITLKSRLINDCWADWATDAITNGFDYMKLNSSF